jgi:hypothetical protein
MFLFGIYPIAYSYLEERDFAYGMVFLLIAAWEPSALTQNPLMFPLVIPFFSSKFSAIQSSDLYFS